MKKGIKILIIVLTAVGLVGAAAAISKGFTEVPDFLVEHTETHETSGGNSNPSGPNNPETDDPGGEDNPEEIIKAAPTINGKYKITLTKKNLLNHPAVAPRVAGTYDLIVESDVEYTLKKIDIKYMNSVSDSWSGNISSCCEFYISTAFTGENQDYFEFGGFTFCDNYSLSVPGELNFTVEITMDITNVDSPEAYTDLFKIGYERIGDLDNPEEDPDEPTKQAPSSTGYYKIELTRDEISTLNDDENILLIDTDNDLNIEVDDNNFYLCSVTSFAEDSSVIDEWHEGESGRDTPGWDDAYSLEIHQDGTSLETQVTGKNDSGLGNWYIDGFITPPETNYTLQIVIKIIHIGRTSDYTSVFLNHYEKLENYIAPQNVSSANFLNNREYVIDPWLIASNIGRLTKNDALTFRKRSKMDFSILNVKQNLDSFEIVGNDNPKHIQCKDGGSSIVSGTSMIFDAYRYSNFFITIEFNNSFTKNGYNQDIVYSNILGYVE